MARRTEYVTIDNENRDKGKTYLITEMPASQAEMWAIKAMLAIGDKVQVPEGATDLGMAGLASVMLSNSSALLGASFESVQDLMDEMFGCIKMCPNPNDKSVTRHLIEDDIEEITTRIKLRSRVLALHLDFS